MKLGATSETRVTNSVRKGGGWGLQVLWPMRVCVGCVRVEMQWARIAQGKRRRLPNPNPGRCCLTPEASNGCLPESAHFALPVQLLLLIPLSLILPVVQYLRSSPPECSRSSRRQVAGGETAPRSSINFVICFCNAWICARSV